VSFSITKNDVGDIQIQNDSPYDVDMSGFVVWGEKEVIFPPKTIILPKATITIAKKRLGLNEQEKLVTLYDTKGNVVTSNFDKFFAVSVEAEEQNAVLVSKNLVTKINVPVSQKTVREPALSHVDVVPDFIEDFTTQALASEDIVVTDFTTDDSSSLEESSNDKKPKSERWPYVVFTALIILSLFGIYLSRR
jgi:hypothetical protein